MNLAERFARLTGTHWHEWNVIVEYWMEEKYYSSYENCKLCYELREDNENPTFEHPEEVLAVMMKRNDWYSFWKHLLPENFIGFDVSVPSKFKDKSVYMIDIDYITEKGKLLQAGHDFLLEKLKLNPVEYRKYLEWLEAVK
jgi:hypothetical protein